MELDRETWDWLLDGIEGCNHNQVEAGDWEWLLDGILNHNQLVDAATTVDDH